MPFYSLRWGSQSLCRIESLIGAHGVLISGKKLLVRLGDSQSGSDYQRITHPLSARPTHEEFSSLGNVCVVEMQVHGSAMPADLPLIMLEPHR